MNTVDFHILWTVILFVLFIAIVLWAWNGKRKAEFDELAHLPLDEEKFAPRVEEKTAGRKGNA